MNVKYPLPILMQKDLLKNVQVSEQIDLHFPSQKDKQCQQPRHF